MLLIWNLFNSERLVDVINYVDVPWILVFSSIRNIDPAICITDQSSQIPNVFERFRLNVEFTVHRLAPHLKIESTHQIFNCKSFPWEQIWPKTCLGVELQFMYVQERIPSRRKLLKNLAAFPNTDFSLPERPTPVSWRSCAILPGSSLNFLVIFLGEPTSECVPVSKFSPHLL